MKTNSFTKSLTLLFFAVSSSVLLSGCGQATLDSSSKGKTTEEEGKTSEAAWHDFTTPDGKLKLQFPVEPKLVNRTAPSPAGDLKITMGVGEVNKKLGYIGMSMKFPVDPATFDVQAGLKGAVANMKGEVLENEDIEKNGFPGNAILVKSPNGFFVRAITYVDGTGPTMYQMNITAAERSDVEGPMADRFFNSLEFSE